MNVLVINLEKSSERWNNVLISSKNQKYNLIRIDGIYGKELDLNTANITNFSKKYTPRGVIGCFLSHCKSWEYIVKNNLDGAIILEDDFRIPNGIDIVDEMYKIKPFMPCDTDVLLLGCLSCTINKNIISTITSSNRPNSGVVNKYIYRPKNVTGLFSYYISNKGARKLLESFKNNNIWHVDIMISKNKNINLYALRYPIFTVNFTTAVDTLNDRNTNKLLYTLDNINMSCINMPSVSLGWILSSSVFRINEHVIKAYHIMMIILLLLLLLLLRKSNLT